MNRSNRLAQVRIYLGKCFRIFVNEKGFKIFISATLITLIICSVTSSDMFVEYNATRNGAFALVCACIWIGIFNSIQSICKERDIIKREHRSGLHISSYVTAHVIYEMVLCIVESVIVTAVICLLNWSNLPESGVMLPMFFELLLTFFITIFASDVLGLMVSSIVKNTNTAMTIMPFILIIQLVMSGMIFELEGITAQVAKLTISKWSLNAICTSANINEMALLAELESSDYTYEVSHLTEMWLILLIFIIVYWLISIISLQFVDKDKR